MGKLPFLIEYGGWVWPFLLVAFLLVWRYAWRGVDRVRGWLRRWAALRQLGEPVAELEGAAGAVVALEGLLELDGKPVNAFEGGSEVAASTVECIPPKGPPVRAHRAGPISLVTDAGRVHLQAPLAVAAGSGELSPRERLWALDCKAAVWRALRSQLSARDARWGRVRFRSLSSGDRVRVVGRLGLRSGSSDDYRSSAAQWTLATVAPDAVALEASLVAGRVRRPWSYRQKLALFCTGLGVTTILLWFSGSVLLRKGQQEDNPTFLQMAAATPFHRGRARNAYASWLRSRCVLQPEIRLQQGNLWRAREALVGCPQHGDSAIVASEVDLAFADYQRASGRLAGMRFNRDQLLQWARRIIAIHIAAHAYGRALAVAKAWDALDGQSASCLALILAYRTGDTSVVEQMRVLARSSGRASDSCWLVAHEIDPTLASGADRRDRLRTEDPPLLLLLDASRDPDAIEKMPEQVEFYGNPLMSVFGQSGDLFGLSQSAYTALARRGDRLGPMGRRLRTKLAYWLGLFVQRSGDEDTARRYIARARAEADPNRADVDMAELILAARAADTDALRARCKATGQVLDLCDKLDRDQRPEPHPENPDYLAESVAKARQGHLVGLMDVRGNWLGPRWIAEVCPKTATARATLRREITEVHGWNDTPSGWFEDLSSRSDIARTCGLDDLVQKYQPLILSHYRNLPNQNDSLLYWALSRVY